MNQEYCIHCGKPLSAEGTMTCWSCERKEIKLGAMLQSNNATEEEVKEAYELLYADIRGEFNDEKISE